MKPDEQSLFKVKLPSVSNYLMTDNGSAPNLSNKSRTLYISTYYAEDAIELSPNHLPSTLTHELVRGEASGRVRCSTYDMQLPEVPKGTSFFAQQASAEK